MPTTTTSVRLVVDVVVVMLAVVGGRLVDLYERMSVIREKFADRLTTLAEWCRSTVRTVLEVELISVQIYPKYCWCFNPVFMTRIYIFVIRCKWV